MRQMKRCIQDGEEYENALKLYVFKSLAHLLTNTLLCDPKIYYKFLNTHTYTHTHTKPHARLNVNKIPCASD